MSDSAKVWLAQIIVSCNDNRNKPNIQGLVDEKLKNLNRIDLNGVNFTLVKINPAEIKLD